MTENLFHTRYPEVYVGAILKNYYTVKAVDCKHNKVLLEFIRAGKTINKWIAAWYLKKLTDYKLPQSLLGRTFGDWVVIEDGIRTNSIIKVKIENTKTGYQRLAPRSNVLKILSGAEVKHRKNCSWKVVDDYVIGKCCNTGLIFYVDYEDYLKIKDIPFCSHTVKGGQPYVCYRHVGENGITENTSLIKYLNLPYWTRFINGNRMDFRRNNIDTTSRDRCNIRNMIPGVWYEPSRLTWRAAINLQPRGGKRIILKTSKDLGKCIQARLEAEQKYFQGYKGSSKSYRWRKDIYRAWGLDHE